jgi:hypothetical protein
MQNPIFPPELERDIFEPVPLCIKHLSLNAGALPLHIYVNGRRSPVKCDCVPNDFAFTLFNSINLWNKQATD